MAMKCCFDTCVSFQFSVHHHHATTSTLAPQKLIFHKLLPTCQKQLFVAEPRWISLRLPTCVCSCLPQSHAVCGQHCLMPYAKLELHSVSHEPAGMLWMDIYLSLSFILGSFFSRVRSMHFPFVIFSLTLPRKLWFHSIICSLLI